MSERWLPIPGYEGAYEVSDLGRVRSLDRVIQRVTGPARYKGRVLRLSVRKDTGYCGVSLFVAGEGRAYPVHELVALAFLGPRPGGAWVAHDDGKPGHNWLTNLRYDTLAGNQADKLRHGTLLHSERHHNARLSRQDIDDIRKRRKRELAVTLAAEFGVSPNHIYRICARKRWSHVA